MTVGRPPRPRTRWGKRLLALRRAHALSRAELARVLGVSKKTIDALEAGERRPPGAVRRLIVLLEQPQLGLGLAARDGLEAIAAAADHR